MVRPEAEKPACIGGDTIGIHETPSGEDASSPLAIRGRCLFLGAYPYFWLEAKTRVVLGQNSTESYQGRHTI